MLATSHLLIEANRYLLTGPVRTIALPLDRFGLIAYPSVPSSAVLVDVIPVDGRLWLVPHSSAGEEDLQYAR